MQTKLYLPYLKFEINDKKGEQVLLQDIIANGPAYKIVAHENDQWLKLQEHPLVGDWIEIIDDHTASEITQEAKRFFSPLIEDIPYTVIDNQKFCPETLVKECIRYLSYILISYRKKAWIYSTNLIDDCDNEIINVIKKKDDLNEEGLERIESFKKLLNCYKFNKIQQLHINDDIKIFNEFQDIFDNVMIKSLSEVNYNFGVIGYQADIIYREIKDIITKINQSDLTPILIESSGLIASVIFNQSEFKVLASILKYFHKKIKNVDLREYAPPIKKEDWFMSEYIELQSFQMRYFNDEYQLLFEK